MLELLTIIIAKEESNNYPFNQYIINACNRHDIILGNAKTIVKTKEKLFVKTKKLNY